MKIRVFSSRREDMFLNNKSSWLVLLISLSVTLFWSVACSSPSGKDSDGGTDTDTDAGTNIEYSFFPGQRGAAGQGHVKITIDAPDPLPAGAMLECKTAHDPDLPSTAWAPCDGISGTTLTFSPIPQPNWEGKTTTLIRLKYADNSYSNVATLNYYLHTSLNGTFRCDPQATDADFFAKAAEKLPNTGTFTGDQAHLANPFINIDFDPPISSRFTVSEGDGPLEALSLRRRFKLSPDRTMLLVTRAYRSRLAFDHREQCYAGIFRIHATHDASDPGDNWDQAAPANAGDPTRSAKNFCDAMVFNTAGAGACLKLVPGDPPTVDFTSVRPHWRWTQSPYSGTGNIDFFMWRKIAPKKWFNFFSPKCWETGSGCTGGDPDVLYLPDHDLYFPTL
jgi:hypothetical protein